MVANIRGYTPNYSFKLINFDTPRWHTHEYDNWSQLDALLKLAVVLDVRGVWTNNTEYFQGELVIDTVAATVFRCLEHHTSAAAPTTFAQDRAAHTSPAYWVEQVAGVPVFRGDWQVAAVYAKGDIVRTIVAPALDPYKYSLCIANHTSSGAITPSDVTKWTTVFDATNVVLDAQQYADDALQSATDAQGFAGAAQTSANTAAGSASAANASAVAAGNSALEAASSQGAFRWDFSPGVTNTDPGVGFHKLNNVDPSLATKLYISSQTADLGNPDISDWLTTWDDSTSTIRGSIYIRELGSPENFRIYNIINSCVDRGTYIEHDIVFVAQYGAITSGDHCAIGFVRAGNQGASGPGGGDMLGANNLLELTDITLSRNRLQVGAAQTPGFAQVTVTNAPTTDPHVSTKKYVDDGLLTKSNTGHTHVMANITDLAAALGLLAPKLDPILSGNPQAPTKTANNNSTSIATTAYADAAASASVGTKYDKAGGVITGDVQVEKINPILDLTKNASTQKSSLRGRNKVGASTPLTRWEIVLGDVVAEDGVTNVGSNFALVRFNDAGTTGNNVFTANRATGVVDFIQSPTVPTINTPSAGADASTKVATTQFVHDAVAADAVIYTAAQVKTANQRSQARSNIDVTKKNYIINGGMQLTMEWGQTPLSASGYYAADCFVTNFAHGGTVSYNHSGLLPASLSPNGGNRLRVAVTAADAALGITDYMLITQNIEGLNVADLRCGTAAAKTVVLQFGVKAPAGTYCVAFQNSAVDRSYVATYTISAGEANTDVVKSVTLQLDQSGTWLVDNTIGLRVQWCLMGGSNYQAAAGSWVAGNKLCTSGQFNWMGTNGNVFELFDVGLYEGNVAPAFQLPDYQSERDKCMRYFEIIGSGLVGMHSTVAATFGAAYAVNKRAQPTVTCPTTVNILSASNGYVSTAAGGATTTFAAADTYLGAAINVNGFSGLTNGYSCISNSSNMFYVNARI